MSKRNDFLNFFLQNIGVWACANCGCGSTQTAAICRALRNEGYHFENTGQNRWDKKIFCEKCQSKTTHYKLLSSAPEFVEKKRLGIDSKSRKRILDLLGGKDAFTGASISSVPEIDHKVPWTRLDQDFNVKEMSDAEIMAAFQLLTREHNLLKDRMCDKCKKTNIRPPFLGISYWYKGDKDYTGTCVGCGWYDGVKWRDSVDQILSDI